jgi:hypothetical protein
LVLEHWVSKPLTNWIISLNKCHKKLNIYL